MSARVTVIYPITFDLDQIKPPVDIQRLKSGDEEYIGKVQEAIKDLADHYLEQGPCDPVIHDSDIPEIVE